MNKNQILNLSILVLAIGVFLMFSFKYIHYTVDDGFIVYRYSDNLANGYGFSWNYDQTQEFGFTGYLHTILVAVGIKFGFDAVLFSKAITILSGLITIVTVGFIVKELTDRKFEFYFLSSLVLGFLPALGLHAIAGLGTTLFLMLFVLSVYSYIVFLRTVKTKHLSILLIFIIFTIFTRYEGALLSIGIIVHQIYGYLILKNKNVFKKIFVFFIPIIFLIGLLSWNYSQFEQFLPNTFYVKKTFEFSDMVNNAYAISLALLYMIPHLLLIVINLKKIMKSPKTSYFIILIIVTLIPFLFINPWINYQHRIYFQVIPLIISLSIFSFFLISPRVILGKYSKIVGVIVVILLVSYNLPTMTETRVWANSYSNEYENTHIKIGTILGKYDELKSNTIGMVGDPGIIPYYSKWKVYDFSLNDRYTAQNGFDVERFYQQNPAVIMIGFYRDGYPQEDLDHLEDHIIKFLQRPALAHFDEITLHPEFKNYKLIAAYPFFAIFAEKEFASQNHQLMQELFDNSTYDNT